MATTVNHSGTAFLKPERSKFDGKGKFGSCLPACRGSIHCVHLVCLILFPVILRPDQFELYPSWKFDTMRTDAEERTNERTSGRINWRIWSLKRNWTLLRMDCGQWVVANGSLVHRIRFIGKVYDCVSLLYDEGVYVYFTRVGVWRDKPQYFTGCAWLTDWQCSRGTEEQKHWQRRLINLQMGITGLKSS